MRRRRRARFLYVIILIAAVVVGWRYIPPEVKDAVRNTYLNPQYDPLAEPVESNPGGRP